VLGAPIRLEGYALHAGIETAVTLARQDGPITFGRGSERAALESLHVVRTDHGVTVSDGRGLEIDLVEHLLAALGGLGIRQGVLAVVEGPELPLLDGGARAFAQALAHLEIAPAPPRLIVERSGLLRDGASEYEFETGASIDVAVEVCFDHPAIGRQRARWRGDRDSFVDDVGKARTFGFRAEAPSLLAAGRARLSTKSSDRRASDALAHAVLVFDAAAPVIARGSRPPAENEVAKHKLLDLIGDFAFYGGPPEGRVFAARPGHTASHRIIREALSAGLLSRR
jgi:UDP-3-O-[3-hydroxymyristoyl] N-acetylglucosamine deacetylase